MKALFDAVSYKTSRIVTQEYSTSFSLGIRLLSAEFRKPVYGVYGFVRLADEIVDSFHDYDKRLLFDEFRKETKNAITRRISLNPVLNSFQEVAHQYDIGEELIETFLGSMEADLIVSSHSEESYKKYILGSAEVVGLMCLKIFTRNNSSLYDELRPFAMALGSAFQKINFLRDLKADYLSLGRSYFPGIDLESLNEQTKLAIEKDIEKDFEKGLTGIRMLPADSRLGVYIAYVYYRSLFRKIRRLHARRIMEERIRIPDSQKLCLFAGSYLRNRLNLL